MMLSRVLPAALALAALAAPAVAQSARAGALVGRPGPAAAVQPASPPDSASIRVQGANVLVRYSRPSKRGRVVFGDSGVALEPWGRVWRLGANEATRLTTDRALVIGNLTVPPGTYTLWTKLDRAGWKLIVNKQTMRPDGSNRPLWGTMYDASQDLGRTAMTMSKSRTPVEQMRIALEPRRPNGATLRVMWDTTQASVPIRVK